MKCLGYAKKRTQSPATVMPDQPKPKRRWFQYSLRTLLVLVAAIGVVLATVVIPAVRQRRAVERVRALDGWIGYDYRFHVDGTEDADASPPGPEWLRGLIGEDFFQTVVLVQFPGSWQLDHAKHVTDQELEALVDLPKLRSLTLSMTSVEGAGLKHLRRLTSLVELDLHDSPVDDAGLANVSELSSIKSLNLGGTLITNDGLSYLRNLPHLVSLDLENTKVSSRGLENLGPLLARLQVLDIVHTQIGDDSLPTLKRMVGLRVLRVRLAQFSDSAYRDLRHSLTATEFDRSGMQ